MPSQQCGSGEEQGQVCISLNRSRWTIRYQLSYCLFIPTFHQRAQDIVYFGRSFFNNAVRYIRPTNRKLCLNAESNRMLSDNREHCTRLRNVQVGQGVAVKERGWKPVILASGQLGGQRCNWQEPIKQDKGLASQFAVFSYAIHILQNGIL